MRVVPALTFEAWLTPPPLGRSTRDRDRAEIAGFSRCHFGGVPGVETGEGPVALAVHGWGGRAAQMAPMARRLAAGGFRVIAPELPGHAGGAKTDIKVAAAAVTAVIDEVGEPAVVVGHSFASMVLRLAFRETAPARLALVAPALDVSDALEVFRQRLRLLPWASSGLRSRLEDWDPTLWPLLAANPTEQLAGAEVLLVHDPEDADTPFVRSAELAAKRPRTSIVPIEGVGHSRILADPKTLDIVAGFAAGLPVSDLHAA